MTEKEHIKELLLNKLHDSGNQSTVKSLIKSRTALKVLIDAFEEYASQSQWIELGDGSDLPVCEVLAINN